MTKRAHVKNLERQRYYENDSIHHYREYSIGTISEHNSIKIFNPIHLSSMEKNYNIIVSIIGIRSRKKSYTQCLRRWKTSDFYLYRQLLHVFNSSKKTPDVFNLTEWEGMLSSRCILNMKRLATLKYK